MHCNKCGSETPSENYCRNCGAPLPKKGKQHKWALVLLYTVLGLIGLFALLVIIALVTDDGNEPAGSSNVNTTITPVLTKAPSAAESTAEPTPTPVADAAYEITNVYVKTWKNSIGTVCAKVIAEITNTGGKNLYLSSCSVDLEDASGELVDVMNSVIAYPQVIAPGEKAYYYDETTIDATEPIELSAIVHPDVKEATVDQILLGTSEEFEISEEYSIVEIKGRVENTTNELQSQVKVSVVLFNSESKPVGVLFTYIDGEIQPGEKIGFKTSAGMLPGSVSLDDIASCEAYAYPEQMQF